MTINPKNKKVEIPIGLGFSIEQLYSVGNPGKILGIIGSSVLIIVAVIHGIGTGYITNLIEASNLNSFLKAIFPVLFIHPTIHLVGIAVLGYYGTTQKNASSLFKLLSLLVALDSVLAFYLNEMGPALILLTSAICFFLTGITKKNQTNA